MSTNGDKPASLAELDESYLICRDLRHAWDHGGAFVVKRRRGRPQEVQRILRCVRCSTERHDYYHCPSWTKLQSSYVYPDGYQVNGNGYTRGEDVRREVFTRIIALE